MKEQFEIAKGFETEFKELQKAMEPIIKSWREDIPNEKPGMFAMAMCYMAGGILSGYHHNSDDAYKEKGIALLSEGIRAGVRSFEKFKRMKEN